MIRKIIAEPLKQLYEDKKITKEKILVMCEKCTINQEEKDYILEDKENVYNIS